MPISFSEKPHRAVCSVRGLSRVSLSFPLAERASGFPDASSLQRPLTVVGSSECTLVTYMSPREGRSVIVESDDRSFVFLGYVARRQNRASHFSNIWGGHAHATYERTGSG